VADLFVAMMQPVGASSRRRRRPREQHALARSSQVWENRSLWIAPLAVAGVILVIAMFGATCGWRQFLDGLAVRLQIDISEEVRNIRNALRRNRQKQIIYAITLSSSPRAAVAMVSFSSICRFPAGRAQGSHPIRSLPVSTEVVLSAAHRGGGRALFVMVVVAQVLFASSDTVHDSVLGDALMAWDRPTWISCRPHSC
jgi:hypothetical protein